MFVIIIIIIFTIEKNVAISRMLNKLIMTKFFVPFLLLGLFFLTGFQKKNIQNDIFLGLKNNSSKTIVKSFSSSVNLILHNESRICNKFQSELILTDFFDSNKVLKVKMVSEDNDKPNRQHIVYEITTEKGTFKVLAKYMDIKGELAVVEFTIM